MRGRKKWGKRVLKARLVEDKSTKREASVFEHTVDSHVFEDDVPTQIRVKKESQVRKKPKV